MTSRQLTQNMQITKPIEKNMTLLDIKSLIESCFCLIELMIENSLISCFIISSNF